MRHVRSRNTPRSGGIVSASPSRCVEHRRGRCPADASPGHLRELLRIADEDDVARARRHRERVGERHLPGLVDEEIVERALVVGIGEKPRGARRDVAVDDVVVVRDVLDVARLRSTTRGCRRSPSSCRRWARRSHRGRCGSPCGSARRRRPSCRPRRAPGSAGRSSTSFPSRAAPG